MATIEFVPVKEYKQLFPQFGHLYDESLMPNNCEVTGILPLQSLVGDKVNLKIITKTHKNVHCSKGGSHIVVQLQSSRGVVPVEVEDKEDGSYSASFVTE